MKSPKEGWALKNWCFQIVVLEKTLEGPLDGKAIKYVNPKGNQTWIFIGRTDTEAEASILWPPDVKSRLIGKDSDAGKDWRRQRMRWLDGIMDSMDMNLGKLQESGGQRSLVCCSPWGCKDWTRLSNWTSATIPLDFALFGVILILL